MSKTTYQFSRQFSRQRSLSLLVAASLLIPLLMVSVRPIDRNGVRPVLADVDSALRGLTTGTVRVIVEGVAGATDAIRGVVARAGGTSVQPLPLVNGVLATVPAATVPALAQTPG